MQPIYAVMRQIFLSVESTHPQQKANNLYAVVNDKGKQKSKKDNKLGLIYNKAVVNHLTPLPNPNHSQNKTTTKKQHIQTLLIVPL